MLQNSNTIQPKVVVIRRRANQGFGFTLRHFIAYPPEDDPSWPQEASDPYQVKAMETIFIKEVQPNGPAHYANLQTGDRVLMVNNTPIAGIAYSTIVSMIKMTPSVLTLHVVPKECDVLQMHYTSIAHTPESNRLTTITIPKPLPLPLTVGNGNVAGALIPLNSSAATTTTKAFPQQQLISYHPLPSHAVLDSGGAVVSGGNTSRSSSITSNSSGLRSLTPAAGAGGNSSANCDFNEYQQSLQQHGALLMRGDGGFMRSQAPQNITVLTRQQPQQQLQNPNTIYAAANSADTSDLMIRLRESIKQKEEFLKSPLPQASQHQQQQQQQHFFPQHTPPPGTSTAAQSHSNSTAQLPMVSGAASSSNAGGIARGQVRTLAKQPLPISACSSAASITSACGSSTGATKDLLPASCDMQNFYAKNLPANFDIAMMSRGNSSGLQHHGEIMKPSTRNRQRSLMTSGNSNIPAWDRYSPKELDYLESLPETGVTNQVFERKLVSHLAKGFDPFKPLSINTNATEVTALAAGPNNSNMAQLKKQPVLYDSLQHHPLHQSQQRQISQPIPLRGCVVDGQQTSRMEIHKANLATTVDYPVATKYSITAPEMAEKATLADIAETNDIPVPCTKSASTSTVTTEGVVRRYRPISSLHDDSKPMRRISYLRATNNENEYHPDTSQSTTATTTTTAPTSCDVTLTVAAATLEASMKSKSLDEPTYEVVGTEREASQPVSLGGSRRASVNSEMRNSIHIESEFNGKMETKDVSTEMDVFETEMEIKSSCINGKRISEYRSWRQVKIEVKGDILKIYPSSRHTKSENNVIELDIRNFNILEEPVDKKKYIFRLQSKPQQQQQPQHQQHSSSCLIASIANELTLEDANRDKLTSSGSSSSTSAAPLELQQQPHAQLQTDILFKTKSMTEMKRIYGLLQWKCSFIYDESDLQGKQLAEPQKTPATASVSTTTATYCDDNVQQQHHQLQLLQPPPEYSPLSSSASTSRCGELEVSDSISPVMKARKSSSHKNIPDKDLGSPKAKNWKDLLFRRGGGNHNADISPSSLASSAKTTGSIGVPLRSCPMSKNNEYVPIIVDICTEIVETKGLSIVGIYRIPGNKAAISELSDQVNKQDFSWDRCATDVRWEDVNVVSSLLKLFIRSLPDALLPSLFYINFIEADKKCGYVRLKELKELLESLPRHSYETMKHLIRHLTRVSKNCAVNLMEPKNLAIIFGPSIIRTPNDTLEIAVKDMKHQCRIVELLLTQYEYFFENGNTPDIADVSGNNMAAAASSSTSSTSQSQEEQTNMLLHNVSKIERLTTDRGEQTSSSSSKTSRFIPNLRRRTHSKRSAVSSDTYSGESVLSLDYSTNKMNATTTTTTSTSSNSSNTNNNNTTTASSSSSSFLSGKKNILGHHTTRIHHRKASLDEKDSGSGSGSSGKDLQQQQRNSVDISILLTDEESSNSRISDSGSMSLTTITDTLDSKLRNLRSGSESNDENDGSPEFQINRRHTFGQPLHLHSENIPYADESPERHYHHPHAAHSSCIDGSSPLMLSSSCSSSTEKETPLHQVQPQQLRSTVGGMKSSHNKLQHSATAPIPTTTLMSPPSTAASTPTAVVTVKTSKTITSNAAGSGIGLIGSNSSGRNLRFSSVYEQCCSEDDSEGSTTSDPKESSVIIASPASFFLDRYNKKRRDHRLFRSASFNCRNYSTRGGGGSGSSGTQNCNSSSALTKDEKTDMNLTKKRQIQNKQNRSIKRRHTVGGPHDYSNNGAGAGAGGGNSSNVGAANNCNNQHCKHNAVGGGAGSTSGGSTSNNVTPSTTTTVLRRIPIPSANGNISNNQQQQQQQQQAHSHSHQQQVADRQQNNNNSNGAVVGEHVLEVGIRIKNINRSRY